jgi:hypothetical protein
MWIAADGLDELTPANEAAVQRVIKGSASTRRVQTSDVSDCTDSRGDGNTIPYGALIRIELCAVHLDTLPLTPESPRQRDVDGTWHRFAYPIDHQRRLMAGDSVGASPQACNGDVLVRAGWITRQTLDPMGNTHDVPGLSQVIHLLSGYTSLCCLGRREIPSLGIGESVERVQ